MVCASERVGNIALAFGRASCANLARLSILPSERMDRERSVLRTGEGTRKQLGLVVSPAPSMLRMEGHRNHDICDDVSCSGAISEVQSQRRGNGTQVVVLQFVNRGAYHALETEDRAD